MALAAALIYAATPLAAGTRRIPSFATGVEVVNLDVSVMDPRGVHVTELAAGDLLLFEDGVPQEVSFFTRDHVPVSLVILLDASGSMAHSLKTAQAAAIRLVQTLRPGDEARVVAFNRHLRLGQEFTTDLGAVEQAIRAIEAQGETSLYTALYLALKDPALAVAAGERRRRAIVVLTDGEDTTSLIADEDVLEEARRAGVIVYAIGLEAPGRQRVASGPPVYFLTALARESGGRAYFPETLATLDETWDRIATELHTLYGLGYVPSNPDRDGQWRRIAVRTARGGLIVRHRPGYYAPSPGRLVAAPR
jgi:Ca-activated chloride channel family protein